MKKHEQRQAERFPQSGAAALVEIESGVEFKAVLRNVSPQGVLLAAQMEPPVGAELIATVNDSRQKLTVVRVERSAAGFDVAGTLG